MVWQCSICYCAKWKIFVPNDEVEIDEQLMKILPKKPMENILEQPVIIS
jgi:hypothetical protein